jgi:hypothetical protein
VARWLQVLHPSRRAPFLVLLSHELAVAVRVLAFEAEAHPEIVERIRILNEAHHRVAGYLVLSTFKR